MKLEKGFKQVVVGPIPEEWDVTTLFDLAEQKKELFDDGDWLEAEHITSDGVRLIQTGNIGIGRFLEKDARKYIFEESFVSLRCKPLEVGDLLICRLAEPAGRACVLPDIGEHKIVTSVDVTIFRPSRYKANRLFLSSLFSTPDWFRSVSERSGGTTHKRIARGALGAIAIPLPPLPEQQAIAEALSDADALIESLSLLQAKKRQIKQGAMHDLLTGKKRLPGFVDSWGSATIGSFTDCTAGGTPSTNIETYWGGDIPWMSSGELHLKHVKDVEGRITDEGLRNSSTKWIPAGCVLIGLAGQGKTRGTVAMNHVPLCTNQSIAAIFPVDTYDSLFLYFNLQSRYEELRELSAGDGGRGGLNLSLIRNLAVPMPCLIEQREIAGVLADIDSDIASVEEKLAKVRDIKQGMMQALLTGRIRLVKPASNVISLPTKPAANLPIGQPTHNRQINEAVVIGMLAQRFGSEKFPLPRKRRVKLTYLLHRHAEGHAEGYLKKAAGPYDPNTKYKGPEQIALKNGYVRALRNEKYEGFVAGDKIEQAQRYFEQWYGTATLEWLERFHYRKTDDLELLATVDMAMVDLAANGEPTDVTSVKRVIAAHPEWLPKLSRELFSDARIAAAIAECQTLFGG